MADLKISNLTASTVPLGGTEVLPIVQSGVTKQVSVANLTAGRAISALGVNISGLTASTALALDASKNVVSVTNTGTGSNVLATSPTLVTPALGTPTSVNLTNALSLPLTTGVTGTLGTTNGGTGLTSFTANGVSYATSTSALTTSPSLTFDGINFSIDTIVNPIHKVRTSGSGNNPVYRLQFGSDYWDLQGTGSNAGKELYFIFTGNARAYINSSTGAYVPISDRRLKKNISNISYGLSAVMALRPVEYLMNNESDDAQKHLGFIAQEALEVIPSSVSEMLDGILGMDKGEIIPVLVKAIQEQQSAIEQLKTELQTIKGV